MWIENEIEYSMLLSKIVESSNKFPSKVIADFVFLIIKLVTIS